MVRLDGDAPDWTVKDITDLTEVSGLDGASRPGWFVPADQLPGRDAGARRLGRPERAAAPPRPSDRDLPRPAGGPDRGGRDASCASASIRTRRELPAGFSADVAGVERFVGAR